MKWNDLSLEDLADIAYTTDVTARIAASAAELLAIEEGRVRVSMVPGKPVAIRLPIELPAVDDEKTGCIWCADTSDEEFIDHLGNTDEEAVARQRQLADRTRDAMRAEAAAEHYRTADRATDLFPRMGAPTPVGQEEALRQTAAWLVTPHPEDGEAVDYEVPCAECQGECDADNACRYDDATDGTDDDPYLVASPRAQVVHVAEGPVTAAVFEAAQRAGTVCDEAAIVADRDGGMKRADLAAKYGQTEPQIQAVLMRAAKRAKETAGQPARPDEPGAITAVDPVQEAVPETAAPASAEPTVPLEAGGGTIPCPPSVDAELWQHVQDVPRDRTWTLQRDHDLLGFAELGWPAHEIALEIQVPSAELKPRFKVLTASNRWKRADVLEALRALVPEAQVAE
ncbi:hypothetical protein [Cereibacter azotoformans]|uniref:hypothetical protein n=1 Tax=Cereibacter azotoformans TaxID=43057 RepID=UPI000C6EFC61|nr:hypothetical protein [Cereibacter azotoformans]